MTTYEQDPDVLQWGLQLFDSDPYSSCGYYGTIMQGDMDHYHGHYFEGDNYDTECSNIENDELIAQALQEELSQLAVVEAPGSPDEELERFQLSVVSQDWLGQSLKNSGSGHECGQEEDDTMRPSTSCSSPDENLYCGDERSYSLELMDEYAFDGEVGKRLTLMVPVPHVPRINGEIPSVDEETLDHQRLLDRLQLYDLVEHKVQGDGNCQFRALSDQFYRTPEHHKFVREQVINQLKSYLEIYEGYVPMAYDDYLEKMSKSGEWGDHVTLQAAADSYGVKIFVITSFKDTCYIEILPNVERSKREKRYFIISIEGMLTEKDADGFRLHVIVICLSFWAEVHYNSIYPEGDVPASMIKKKKRRWMLRNKHLESPDQG